MKIHRIIITYIFLLCTARLHSQDIIINLSLRWEDAPCVFNSDLMVSTPRLIVSYNNESDKNLYFLKISKEEFDLPKFPGCPSGHVSYYEHTEKDYTDPKSQMWHRNYDSEEFVVELRLTRYPIQYWWVIPKSVKESLKDEGSFEHPGIDCTLADITDFIMKKFHGGLNDSLYPRYFNLSDITENALANGSEKNLCFLRAGESKEDVYDITALWMVKGIFEFEIANERFPDEVVVGENLHDPSGVIYPTAKLPEKVGDYQLYTGEFTCNRLTVEF